LTHQSALVHALLADAAAECWMWPTPAVGWTVAHHVAHLLWTDGNARHSLLGRHAFAAIADRWGRAAIIDPDVRSMMAEGLDHSDLLSRWHTDRTELVATLRRGIVGRHAEGPALPVDPEGLASVLLMETWAHGHD
ncbi:maleylpyruvate isomerase N-terminal domain-containing protein, partial [Acinetobacter baumannii]|uniref:maleylpyruvate isomerase N-terminal domain-containing protein n=1 Tax=Acinetobacter baumannii TaxID=470 RepID=UPI0018999431